VVGRHAVLGDRRFISTLQALVELRIGGADVLCFHGSPSAYDEMIQATTSHEVLERMLHGFDQPLLLGVIVAFSSSGSLRDACSSTQGAWDCHFEVCRSATHS
jgi:hypothetical protein